MEYISVITRAQSTMWQFERTPPESGVLMQNVFIITTLGNRLWRSRRRRHYQDAEYVIIELLVQNSNLCGNDIIKELKQENDASDLN
jgi:hypothetical protein